MHIVKPIYLHVKTLIKKVHIERRLKRSYNKKTSHIANLPKQLAHQITNKYIFI